VECNRKKGSEEVAVEQNRGQGRKAEIRAEARVGSHQQPNQTIQFLQVQDIRGPPRLAPVAHWCPSSLTPSLRRRIHRMRVQTLREEATEKGKR
jgi:hypothetical protein